MKRAGRIRRNSELITRDVRAPGVDLIVLREDPRAPDVMLVVITAVGFNQVRLVIVRRLVQIAAGLDEAGTIEGFAGVVTNGEFDKGLVKIAQLRRKRMANVLVRDDDFGGEAIAASDTEAAAIDR